MPNGTTMTLPEWARSTGRNVNTANYVVLRYRIDPVQVAGSTRLFSRADLDAAAAKFDADKALRMTRAAERQNFSTRR